MSLLLLLKPDRRTGGRQVYSTRPRQKKLLSEQLIDEQPTEIQIKKTNKYETIVLDNFADLGKLFNEPKGIEDIEMILLDDDEILMML